MKNRLILQISFFSVSLLFALTSCSGRAPFDAQNVVRHSVSTVENAHGTPEFIDTVKCWHISNGSLIELVNGKVYNFIINTENDSIVELMQRNREHRKAHRHTPLSILDIRLLMSEDDLNFLLKDVKIITHYYYYNYGDNLRLRVDNERVSAVGVGLKSDLEMLDKIRLNLNGGSMRIINIALAFIMFGVALNMKISGFKDLLKRPRLIITGIVSQFILLPCLTFLLVLYLQPPASIALGMILVAACPGGNVSNFICTLGKGNVELSVALTVIATMLAIVMTPFNFAFWSGLYATASGVFIPISIGWWQMTRVVLILLGAPIIVGMLVRHYFSRFADRLEKPMKRFSIVFFLVIVVGAIAQNFIYFKTYAFLIVAIVIFHNFIAFFTGYSFATIMRVRSRERRSITIETGIQNSGLALVLIVNPFLFDGLGGMAFIAAVWGIWHVVSGMIVGSIWSLQNPKEIVK